MRSLFLKESEVVSLWALGNKYSFGCFNQGVITLKDSVAGKMMGVGWDNKFITEMLIGRK